MIQEEGNRVSCHIDKRPPNDAFESIMTKMRRTTPNILFNLDLHLETKTHRIRTFCSVECRWRMACFIRMESHGQWQLYVLTLPSTRSRYVAARVSVNLWLAYLKRAAKQKKTLEAHSKHNHDGNANAFRPNHDNWLFELISLVWNLCINRINMTMMLDLSIFKILWKLLRKSLSFYQIM